MRPAIALSALAFSAAVSAQSRYAAVFEQLPAQRDISTVTVTTPNPPATVWQTHTTLCQLSTGATFRIGDGVMFDTQRVYQLVYTERGLCKLELAIEIQAQTPSSAQELLTALAATNPLMAAYLTGRSMPIAGSAAQGIRIPYDLMTGARLMFDLGRQQAAQGVQGRLPAGWQQRTDLVAARQDGEPKTVGHFDYMQCAVQIGQARPQPVWPSAVFLADTQRAYYADAQCRIFPLIILPSAPTNAAPTGTSGGRMPLPPVATNPPASPPATPAVALPFVPSALPVLAGGLAALGLSIQQGWLRLGTIVQNNSHEAERAFNNQKASGLSAEQWGSKISRESESQKDNRPPDECDKIYNEVDIPTCNGIRRSRGAESAAKCFESAAARYAACISNKPLPPLYTWN